jgi:hypothetical protein
VNKQKQMGWGIILLVVVSLVAVVGTLFGGLWAMSLLVQAWSRRQLFAMPVVPWSRSRAGA